MRRWTGLEILYDGLHDMVMYCAKIGEFPKASKNTVSGGAVNSDCVFCYYVIEDFVPAGISYRVLYGISAPACYSYSSGRSYQIGQGAPAVRKLCQGSSADFNDFFVE
jgi:hypothetical protein